MNWLLKNRCLLKNQCKLSIVWLQYFVIFSFRTATLAMLFWPCYRLFCLQKQLGSSFFGVSLLWHKMLGILTYILDLNIVSMLKVETMDLQQRNINWQWVRDWHTRTIGFPFDKSASNFNMQFLEVPITYDSKLLIGVTTRDNPYLSSIYM